MCRWLSYAGSPIYLDSLIFEPENSLIRQSLHARKTAVATNGDGFGVGWYGDRPAPGVYRDILPAWNDANLKSLAHQIRAPLFFAHVRASTGTATSRANCHPFAHGQWLFMHNGQIGDYETVRRALESRLPDALYRRRLGTTDSELFFLLLFTQGLEEDPVGAIRRTVGLVEGEMRAAGVTEPFRLTAALSDGARVIAVRHSSDAAPPSLFWGAVEDGLMVLSEPLDADPSHWNAVPADSIVIVDRRGCVGHGAPVIEALGVCGSAIAA